MSKLWKAVGVTALALFILGLVLCGAGWLTGASPARMAELIFGGTDAAVEAGKAAMTRLSDLWRSVAADVGAWF